MLLQLPYLPRLKGLLIAGVAGFALGVCCVLAFSFFTRPKDTPMPTDDASVPAHEINIPEGTAIKALDKGVLKDRGTISRATEKDTNKEVLATGTVKTSDGTKSVAAVLNISDGNTTLVEHKPFSEFMTRQELGIGYGLIDGDLARAAQYRFTFGRIWRLYGTLQVEAFQVDRLTDRNPWNVMAFVSYRW